MSFLGYGRYAPFCKHLFVPNFTDAKVGAILITEHNRHLLRYARTHPPAMHPPSSTT